MRPTASMVIELSAIPVGRRRFHAFISHAHVDRSAADALVEWLDDTASIPVWYDAVQLPPGATIAQALPDAIENSRSMIILLSEESVKRGWVQQEYNAAINHQTQYPKFRIIPARIDDVQPPGFLANYSGVSLGPSGLTLRSAADLIKGLYMPTSYANPRQGRDAYVSRGWQTGDEGLAEPVCSLLADAGLRLLGDAEDRASWDEARVGDIMDGCGAFVAVLPYRPSAPYRTSQYTLREWELAASRNLRSFVVADARIELSDAFPGEVSFALEPNLTSDLAATIMDAVAEFVENWQTPGRSTYIFHATGFNQNDKIRRRMVKEVSEAITAVPCLLGEYVEGEIIQSKILDLVTNAMLILADISADNANVYVEVGAAKAAGVPVRLLGEGPPKRPAFMLRDLQIWDYTTDVELLGRVTRILYPYRRRVL
jgi:TIR domain